MHDVDVVVVGGGPVGLMTAILSTDRGLTVRVLEWATEVYDLPRAIVMDDEVQRVFQSLGLAHELAELTTPVIGAEFVTTAGERIVGAELPVDAPWPLGHHPTVAYYQPELEGWLWDVARRVGVDLRLGIDVAATGQDEARAWATTSAGDQHTGRWLVGADGASSAIRKSLDIAFVDQGFDQDWLVLDVRLRRPVPTLPPFVQQVCDRDRPTTFVVGHGPYRRWEFQVQPGEDRDAMVRPDRVWELLRPWLTPDDGDLVRAVVYRFHATVADAMRRGRIFLAGDAAHQMPPFLGQGLCSGVRDAANLAWKLALVTDGRSSDRLLDTYGEERLPHAAGVVAHAADTGRLIDQLAGRAEHGTGVDAAYGGGRPFPTLTTGLRVGDHPAVGRQLPQPMLDGRPLDERLGRWFAVVVDDVATVTDDVRSAWGDLLTVVVVPAGTMPLALPPGGAVVVRPDRYVAGVAHDATELAEVSSALLAALA